MISWSLFGLFAGVFGCAPTLCDMHDHKQAILLGNTALTHEQFKALLKRFSESYQASMMPNPSFFALSVGVPSPQLAP
jgi:hypothetical protein